MQNVKVIWGILPMQALEETDFGDLCELFAPLMHVICLIFSTSAHYNTPARIIVLVQVIIYLTLVFLMELK